MTTTLTQTATVTLSDGTTRPFTFPADLMSRQISQDCLQGLRYPPVNRKLKIGYILDVGAGIGAASVYFASLYPAAVIHAFEPYTPSFRMLQSNTEGLNVRCHNHAVLGLMSHLDDRHLYGSRQGPSCYSTWDDSHPSVQRLGKPRKITELVKGIPPDILKVDTEGSEWAILSTMTTKSLARIPIVYLEYHSETHRLRLDELFADTHVLFASRASKPHIGQLTFVRRDIVGEDPT